MKTCSTPSVTPWPKDRLFQLDYLRRKGHGRLAEILGEEGVQLDTIARTVGLNRIAPRRVGIDARRDTHTPEKVLRGRQRID